MGAPVTREDVREFYSQAAQEPRPELCCPGGYAGEDTAHIPPEVLARAYGCGSPVGLAGVRPGETVLDLGSGAGIDVFVAAKRTGPRGKALGVDMTPAMLAQALVAAGAVSKSLGWRNIEFRHGFLEDVPADDASVDLVTSNCVLNLSTDKPRVFREIARILRDGGRFVIADIVSEKPVPEALRRDKKLWGECLSGALGEEEFLETARAAGLSAIEILKKSPYREAEGLRFLSVVVRGWKGEPKDAASCCAPAPDGRSCC